MAKRAARAEQTGFDIGGNGASVCPECSAPEYERHADGCPLAVTDAGAGGDVLNGAAADATALARELQSARDRVRRLEEFNAQVRWSTDAIGTWFFLMDGEQPLPLGVYGPDRAAERDRILTVLQRATHDDGANTRGD